MLRSKSGVYVPEAEDDLSAIFLPDTFEVGVDVETRPRNPKRKTPDAMNDFLVGAGVSFYEGDELCFTMYGLAEPWWLQWLEQALPRAETWYAHNAIFDAQVLRRYGVKLGRDARDARIIAYLLGQPEAGLKPLLREWLGVETEDFDDVLARNYADNIAEVPLLEQADYCGAQDAELCVPLERAMREHLADTNPRAFDVYEKVERFMVPVLVDMTTAGIPFKREAAQPRWEEAVARRDGLDEVIGPMVRETGFVQFEKRGGELWHPTCKVCRNGKKKRQGCEACGGRGKLDPVEKPFNSGSSDQVRAFLYDHLHLPETRFTGGVQPWMIEKGYVDPEELTPSTDALAMLRLKDQHPTIPLMLVRRKWKKDAEFLGKWLTLSEADGLLHTQFTNTTVASGRLSSRDPNLQQVTLRFRDLMVAPEGCEIVAGDMSQLELVISAYMSNDPVMLEILRNGWDMHRITAEAVYGIPWRDIAKDSPMRACSKVANYLSSYGGKKNKLREGIEKNALQSPELGIEVPSLPECDRILQAHRRKYAQYWTWVGWTIARTRELGYSETAFGRPRYFPDIKSYNDEYRAEAERAAVNHAIQGTAADLMKMAMKRIADDQEMSSWGYMVLQVHDEIVSVVKQEFVVQYMERLQTYMELGQPFEPRINLTVDIGHGPNWKDTHK